VRVEYGVKGAEWKGRDRERGGESKKGRQREGRKERKKERKRGVRECEQKGRRTEGKKRVKEKRGRGSSIPWRWGVAVEDRMREGCSGDETVGGGRRGKTRKEGNKTRDRHHRT